MNDEGYLVGPPELAAEVASSSESYDLHSKRVDYERHGVGEYLVLVLRLRRAVWLVRESDRFVEMPPGADGIYRSTIFPGLWLDATALFAGNTRRVQEVLNQGLNSSAHGAFVTALKTRR